MGAVVSCVSLVTLPWTIAVTNPTADHLCVPRHRRCLDGCRQRNRCHPQGHHQRNRRRLRHHHLLPYLRQRWRWSPPQDNKCGLVSGSELEGSARAQQRSSLTSKRHRRQINRRPLYRSISGYHYGLPLLFTRLSGISFAPAALDSHISLLGIHDQSWIHHPSDTNHTSYALIPIAS
jgi:hypothetical protein